jgi:CheY-like chemotaxis protein
LVLGSAPAAARGPPRAVPVVWRNETENEPDEEEEQQEQREQHEKPLLPLAGKSVLLVDDVRSIRLVGRRLLERAGAKVELAGDGTAAVATVAASLAGSTTPGGIGDSTLPLSLSSPLPPPPLPPPPLPPPPPSSDLLLPLPLPLPRPDEFDLVLMDYHMHPMDGLQALKCIREAHGDRAPPVVVLTAACGDDVARLFSEAGAVGMMTKPYTQESLVHAVLQHARKKR